MSEQRHYKNKLKAMEDEKIWNWCWGLDCTTVAIVHFGAVSTTGYGAVELFQVCQDQLTE